MIKKNNVYIPGLIFCTLGITVGVINMFYTYFTVGALVSLLLPLLLCCIYCVKNKKIFVVISYLYMIVKAIISIFTYRNGLINEYESGMLFRADVDKLFVQNMITQFIFSILPIVLLLSGLLIKKKGYVLFVTIVFALVNVISIGTSFYTILTYGIRSALFSNVNSVFNFVCILVIWYKVGLSQYINRNRAVPAVEIATEKEIFSAEISLEDLKVAFEKGEINEAEYNEKKAKIISSL